ncbi:MAG: hypothetical protein AB4057_22125 [Crocosphaera sp.]
MTKSRLGGMGKLSQFSGIKQPLTSVQNNKQEVSEISIEDAHQDNVEKNGTSQQVLWREEKPVTPKKPVSKTKKSTKDKLVNINIKIKKSQKDWLSDQASQVRDNNDEPVPPNERVYPQHLIGVAIDLLKSQDIDWSEIKNERQLRELLNL